MQRILSSMTQGTKTKRAVYAVGLNTQTVRGWFCFCQNSSTCYMHENSLMNSHSAEGSTLQSFSGHLQFMNCRLTAPLVILLPRSCFSAHGRWADIRGNVKVQPRKLLETCNTATCDRMLKLSRT